jgi:hypothetical protein
MEMFQTATSRANIAPHSIVRKSNFTEGILNFPDKKVNGTSTAAAIAIL